MHKGVRVSGLLLGLVIVAGCGIKEPPPFDPRLMQEPERDRAADTPPAPMKPLPTTLEAIPARPEAGPTTYPTTGRAIEAGPTVRLPLQEVIQRSVANSSEVKVSGYDPAIAETRIIEAEARYDPTFFTNVQYQHLDQKTPGESPQNPLVTTQVQRGDLWTVEPGVKQLLPSGGEASVSYPVDFSYYKPRVYPLNDYWDNTLKFTLTQPLLRDFGYQVNYARIFIARNDERVSVLDFRKTLEENIEKIEEDYWQLAEAQRDVDIQEELLENTRDTADVLFRRFQQGGDVSRVQTSQAAAAIRAREAVLITFRQKIRDLSYDIKRRMNDPEFPVAGTEVVLPASDAIQDKVEFDPKELIDTAMENRLELGQQQIRVTSAGIAMDVAKNGLYPKLDAKLAFGVQSLDQSEWGSFHGQTTSGHFNYQLGLALEIPIGNREARSIYRRAQLQRMQAIEQYHNIVSQVSEDVSQAYNEVISSWDLIGSRRAARFLAGDELEALQQQQDAGEKLTPTFVQLKLDAQDRLAQAQRDEATAISQYNIAISHLERSKGTLLRYNNVVMAEERPAAPLR